MKPIQSLMNAMTYTQQLKCDDFDRMKAYMVIKNDGNVYVIKRIKLSEINLDTLKKMGSMIENGQVWIKKGNKFEDKKFVGIGIQERKIETIIVEKSDDKYGKRDARTINKNNIHVEEMSEDDASKIAKIAEDLVMNVFEQKQRIVHSNQAAKHPVIKEDVQRHDKNEIVSSISSKEKIVERKKKEARLQEQSIVKSRKNTKKLQKTSIELDEKSDEIRKKSVKIEKKHESILNDEIKNSRIK